MYTHIIYIIYIHNVTHVCRAKANDHCSVLARPNLQSGLPFLDLKFDFICNDPSFPETGKQFSPLCQLFR